MKAEQLPDAMDGVDEKYIREVEKMRKQKQQKRRKLLQMAALAACLCLLVGVSSFAGKGLDGRSLQGTMSDSASQSEPAQGTTGCGGKQSQESTPLVGGWTQQDSEELTQEQRDIFTQAVSGTDAADYEPTALLGTQVVAGCNYRFQCTAPDGTEKVVTVYQDLQGTCTVTSVEDAE